MTIEQSLMQTLATVLPNEQLQPLDFVAPGFRGLNTVQAGSLMDPGYCTVAQNAVIDTSARLAARSGAQTLTSVQTLTFTAPPTGTGGTLTSVWTPQSGSWLITFSDGEVRIGVFTHSSASVSWYTALTGTPTVTATTTLAATEAVTFTIVPSPTGVSGTLTANWAPVSGIYQLWFSDGENQLATFTQGSTAVTWNVGLTGSPSVHALVVFSIQSIFEYNLGGGNGYQQIIAWPGGISNNPTNPLAGLISGAVNVENGRWFFVNFNDKCIGFQSGQTPIVYTGTGVFATITASAGTVPTGGVGTSAFGRIWTVGSDLQTIGYSGLLDETDWSTTDGNAGIIDMHTIWSDGTDQVTAIFAFNASLIVCGTKHIILFTDGRGSMLGMDPTQAYVFDMLVGTGCLSQWTVDHIGEGDVLFLSPNGVQSLQRLLTARNNPVEILSKYNRDALLAQIQAENPSNISGCFNQLTGFYILGLPVSQTTWCFDQRRNYQDDVGALCSITTTWTMALTACCSLVSTQQLFLARANQGTVCIYSGALDEGSTYIFQYSSPWMNLGQQVAQHYKMLKRLTLILNTGGGSFSVQWAVDFNAQAGSTSQIVASSGASSLWGQGLWGVALWGGGSNLYLWKYAAHIKGQYYQLTITTQVSSVFAIQQAQFTAKIGRIA